MEPDSKMLLWYTRVPRVQYLMKEVQTKSVCAIAKDTKEIHASAMSKTGGKYKAANGTRFQNLGQQKVIFTTMKAKSAVWVSRSPTLNAP